MQKKISIISVVFILSAQLLFAQKITIRFIDKYLPLAQKLSAHYKIPVSILLGVSILESGSGSSINCKQLNNFFGVTGKNHLKKRRTMYKQYANAEASFTDFCEIMSRKKFYSKLINTEDYTIWLSEMNKASYAGAKQIWISRVKSIIHKNKLYNYHQD